MELKEETQDKIVNILYRIFPYNFLECLCNKLNHRIGICSGCVYSRKVTLCGHCDRQITFDDSWVDDDFVFRAYVSESGDACCIDCIDAEQEEYYDDYDDGIIYPEGIIL